MLKPLGKWLLGKKIFIVPQSISTQIINHKGENMFIVKRYNYYLNQMIKLSITNCLTIVKYRLTR